MNNENGTKNNNKYQNKKIEITKMLLLGFLLDWVNNFRSENKCSKVIKKYFGKKSVE